MNFFLTKHVIIILKMKFRKSLTLGNGLNISTTMATKELNRKNSVSWIDCRSLCKIICSWCNLQKLRLNIEMKRILYLIHLNTYVSPLVRIRKILLCELKFRLYIFAEILHLNIIILKCHLEDDFYFRCKIIFPFPCILKLWLD